MYMSILQVSFRLHVSLLHFCRSLLVYTHRFWHIDMPLMRQILKLHLLSYVYVSLQHITTHCNTLQHTATYCNIMQTLQHTTIDMPVIRQNLNLYLLSYVYVYFAGLFPFHTYLFCRFLGYTYVFFDLRHASNMSGNKDTSPWKRFFSYIYIYMSYLWVSFGIHSSYLTWGHAAGTPDNENAFLIFFFGYINLDGSSLLICTRFFLVVWHANMPQESSPYDCAWVLWEQSHQYTRLGNLEISG